MNGIYDQVLHAAYRLVDTHVRREATKLPKSKLRTPNIHL